MEVTWEESISAAGWGSGHPNRFLTSDSSADVKAVTWSHAFYFIFVKTFPHFPDLSAIFLQNCVVIQDEKSQDVCWHGGNPWSQGPAGLWTRLRAVGSGALCRGFSCCPWLLAALEAAGLGPGLTALGSAGCRCEAVSPPWPPFRPALSLHQTILKPVSTRRSTDGGMYHLKHACNGCGFPCCAGSDPFSRLISVSQGRAEQTLTIQTHFKTFLPVH